MQIAMVGLGRMGGNMARRLARAGIGVAGYAWVDSGYEKIERGNPNEQNIAYWLQQALNALQLGIDAGEVVRGHGRVGSIPGGPRSANPEPYEVRKGS